MSIDGRKRTPKVRVILTVVLALSVVLAGCTGLGGLGGASGGTNDDSTAAGAGDSGAANGDGAANGGGSDAGDGADDTDNANAGSDADSGDSAANGGENAADGGGNSDVSGSNSGNSNDVVVPLADDPEEAEQWFNLSTPGRYDFEVESAEDGTGKMSFETSPAGDGQVTVDTHYEMGGESSDSSVTAPVGEAQGQLATAPGFQYLILLSLSGLGPAAALGGGDLKVGNTIQRSTDGGSYSIEVTDTRNYGGVECYFIETRTNGTLTNEVCTQGAFLGAPYVATYNESGLQQRIELVKYERK